MGGGASSPSGRHDGPRCRHRGIRRATALVPASGVVTAILLLALAILSLAACAQGGEQRAERLARDWWLQKYGEDRSVSEVIRPGYPTSIPWPSVDEDALVVNLGEAGSYDSLVLVDLKTGTAADNHQSSQVQKAVDAYVRKGLSGFVGTGRIESVSVTNGSEDGSGYLSLDEPHASSSPSVFPDDAPPSARMFFSTRYDGDAEAFVRSEQEARGIALEGGIVYVGVDVPMDVPVGVATDGSATWREDVDPMRDWLTDRFDAYPDVVVLPEEALAHGAGEDSPFRLGLYPGGSGADEEPIVDSWVTLGERSEIRLESDEAGMILADDGLRARRLDPAELDLEALVSGSTWTLADVRDAYVISLAGEALAQARRAVQDEELPSPTDLRMTLDVPDEEYGDAVGLEGSDGVSGSAEYERNLYAYVMETTGTDDAGGVTPAGPDDRLRPEVASDGVPARVSLRDPSHALLVVVGRRAAR